MAVQLPAPYYYGPDKFVRFYDDLLKRPLYWPRPISSETGNYVTLDLAVYLFQTVPGTEADLLTAEQLPPNVRDAGGSYGDDLQTMADQNNRIRQSLITGGYSMDAFPRSQKGRRRGVASIDITDYQDYGSLTQTREGLSVLESFDLDQQINSSVGLSVDEFLAVAQVQGLLVPYLSTYEGRSVNQIARVSLPTFIGAIMPLILAQLPIQTSPTNPVTPTKTLTDFDIDGLDRIVEGVLDTQYRASVIYSDTTAGVVATQGQAVDGFIWAIIGHGEQISVTGILPIFANDVLNDGRTFILELRHVSLPKVARRTITIVDGTVAPAPPVTADPFIELLIDADARSIRVRYRLGGGATQAALAIYRDGNVIYSKDGLGPSYDLSNSGTVLPGTYYARVYEPNKDSNFLQTPPQTIKGTVAGTSVVTMIDYAHQAKGADGYPELDLWFKASADEAIFYTITTEDLPESSALPTKAYSGSDGYSRQQQQTNIRGNQVVTIKAWTLSNQAGAISKQFRIVAGAARNTVYGAAAVTPPAATAATIITAMDTLWAADGSLTVFVKTSRADGAQFAIGNDQNVYSGFFGASPIDGDSAGYQYKAQFSASAVGSKSRLRFRPTANSAEAAIAYLTLVTPSTAQARSTQWANGAQLQAVSGDFSIVYADSNLGGGPVALFQLLPIWNEAGTQVRFRRIYTGQIPDGYTEYWTFDKEGLAPDPNKVVNPYQGRDIENVIWFPPNYNVDIECFWAKGPEVNRGYSYGYCAAIGKATIYTGTKPAAN